MSGNRLVHLVQYVCVRSVMTAALSLGFEGAARLARMVAGLLFRWDEKHRRRALENLSHALPDLTRAEHEQLVRQAFTSFALTLVESLYISRLIQRGNVHRYLEVELHPEADRAMASGRAALFVTAHIGNWELSGTVFGLLGYPLLTVGRPISNPYLDRLVIRNRERLGQEIVSKRGAVRALSRAIRKGRLIGLLVDQNTGRHGIFADFFGRPASTTGAPATLALKYDVPLLPGWQQRIGPGFKHRVMIEAPISIERTGDRDTDILLLTQAMNDSIEAFVRQAPGQWLWAHRRWKTRPPEEESPCPSNRSTSSG